MTCITVESDLVSAIRAFGAAARSDLDAPGLSSADREYQAGLVAAVDKWLYPELLELDYLRRFAARDAAYRAGFAEGFRIIEDFIRRHRVVNDIAVYPSALRRSATSKNPESCLANRRNSSRARGTSPARS